MGKSVYLLMLAVACSIVAANSQSKPQSKPQVHEQAGNSVVMDDSFEYAILDYGVGQFQVRTVDKANSLSPNVFWVKLGIRNADPHLIKGPRYISSVIF